MTEASRPGPAPAGAEPRFRYAFGQLTIHDPGAPAPAARYIGDVMDVPTLDGDDAGTAAVDAEPLQSGRGSTSCTDICNRAYASSDLNYGGGGVVCDGATKCPCAFDVAPLTRGQCSAFDANVLAHERRHLGDVDCDATKGLHRPPFRDPSRANASECTHRRESIAELDAVIPSQTGDCRSGMQTIRDRLNGWVTAHCGAP